MRAPARTLAALAAALPAAPAAAADALPPLPTWTAAYTPSTVDERGLWQQADENERALRDSPSLVRDAALNGYVRGVLCRAVGEERCRATRLYIQHVPAFNAFMMPNGALVVWTGLLLRMRNEAELAAVLGHEFGHFELRHKLRDFKRLRATTDATAWLTILSPQGAAMSTNLVGLNFAFDRAQESEADLLGLRFAKAARYKGSAAAEVWHREMAEQDATATGRKRHVADHYSVGFFADHPSDAARADALTRAAGPDAAGDEDGAARYAAATASWRGQWLSDQIRLNDFGGSEYLLAQLAGDRWTPDLLFARGELYRERGNPRDLVSAAGFYAQAIDGGCTDPAAWRGLGLAQLRSGQEAEGRAALAGYLKRAPDAPDRAAIAMLVAEGATP